MSNTYLISATVCYNVINENTYAKGRALVQLYGVVPQTKRWNAIDFCALNSGF